MRVGAGHSKSAPAPRGGKSGTGAYMNTFCKVAQLVCPFRGELSPLGGQVAVCFRAYKLYCRYVRYVSLCISVFKITATYELRVNRG